MSDLTPQQEKKLRRLARVVEDGLPAILEYLFDIEEKMESSVEKFEGKVEEIRNEAIPKLQNVLDQVRGKDGFTPVKGTDYDDGKPGDPGKDGKDYVITDGDLSEIARRVRVPVVEKVIERTEVIHEQPIVKETTHSTTIENPVTPVEIATKLNTLTEAVEPTVIKGWKDLERNIKENLTRIPKDFDVRIGVSKTELKRLTDRVEDLEGSSAGSGHTVQDEGSGFTQRTNLNFVGAGVTVTDDAGNDATVVTISGGSGGGFQAPSSGILGQDTFVWATAPNVIVVDGVAKQKTQTDGSTNWTGTTTTVLTVFPTFDIFAVS